MHDDELFRLYASQAEETVFFYHDRVAVSKENAKEICTRSKFQNNDYIGVPRDKY